MTKKFVAYILFTLSFSTFVHSQDIRFRALKTKNGFPSKSIETIVQDSMGYMWFGAFDGLIKYDGNNFTVYERIKGDTTSLQSRNAFALHVDNKGQLWVGGDYGLSIYQPETDNFKRFPKKNITDNTIHGIISDNDGTIWVGTTKGLYRYDTLLNDIVHANIDVNILYLKSYQNLLFAGTELHGLYVFDIKEGKITRKINNTTFDVYDGKGLAVSGIDFDEHHNVWFSTSNGGLYMYDYKNDKLTSHDVLFNGKKTKNTFFSVSYISKEKILIGTQNNGFVVYNSVDDRFSMYYTENKSDYSIISNSIRFIYKAKDDVIWLGTHLGGVCYYSKEDIPLAYYEVDVSRENWLSFDVVSSFTEDSSGKIWISTDGGGINIFDKKETLFDYIDMEDGLLTNSFTDIETDSQGYIWFSPWHGAITRTNPLNMKREVMHYNTQELNYLNSWNEIKGIFRDSQNRIWAFPVFQTPMIYHEKEKTFYNINNPGPHPASIFGIQMLIDAIEDKNGNIWIYGLDGIGMLTPDYKFIIHNNDLNDPDSIMSNNIINIFADDNNYIWISTFDGLERYHEKNGSFEHITLKHNFPKKVYSMLQDKNGYIWMTCSNGLGRFHPDSMKIQYFEKNIGIANDEFVNRSCYEARDGTMYFGGTKGFICFNPDSLKLNPSKPRVLITDFLLFNKINKHTDSLSPLNKPINVTDTLVLPYYLNIIGFRFSATNFVASENNSYAYRLRGFNDMWNYVQNKNNATYTNLDAGTYTLEVKSANNEGIWSDSITKLTIIITPPWWELWWFKILVAFFLIGVILMIFYLRMARIRNMNRVLEQKVNDRTTELQFAYNKLTIKQEEVQSQNIMLAEQNEYIITQNFELKEKSEEIATQRDKLKELNKTKDKFFSIIAHDLKNPLNTLMGFAELLNNSFEDYPEHKKKKFINIIANSSKNLSALLDNLLTWSRSQSGTMPFNPEIVNLNKVIDETLIILKHQAEKKQIAIIYQQKNDIVLNADANMLSTVIRNITSNAIKFTPQGGKISLKVDEKVETVKIAICDSGVGMSPKQIEGLFKIDNNNSTKGTNSETGTGLGLILCKEFIDMHNGKIWVESEKDKGSIFYVELNKAIT